MHISAIIPTLNEAENVQIAVRRAWNAGVDEVIVVDGGSRDATCALAAAAECRLVHAPAGRGTQQGAGARIATGDVLLFLHVDNWLAPEATDQIRSAFRADATVVGGSFCQAIMADGTVYRLLEAGNRFRARVLKLPYGDQGLFINRSTYESVGGFARVPIMEDVILAKQMGRHGRIVNLAGPLHVDARRWKRHGVLRQTLRNWVLITAFHCGVSPYRLARFYARHDQRPPSPERSDLANHRGAITPDAVTADRGDS